MFLNGITIYNYNQGAMLKWLLIISITLVSTSMLVFASAYLAIISETEQYYNKGRTYILLLSNSFNILYLIVTPFIFSSLKKRYSCLVLTSVVLTAVGCVGRYLCQNNYYASLLMSSLVALGHIPVITAPYGLLQLFPEKHKGYAASIPLFVPTLGINFSIIYGMSFIASSEQVGDMTTKFEAINTLNLIIALLGAISCLLSIVFMIILKRQIRKINEQSCQHKDVPFIKQIRNQFKGGKLLMLMLACWGTILGLNWTYGGMFQIFLQSAGLSNKDMALIGLYANLSSVFFSNLGNWISNHLKLSHRVIIFALNLAGFFSSLVIQASSSLDIEFFRNKYTLIVAIIILRAGFSSFVSLALIQLGHCGSSVLISSIFFYVANASNLGGNYIVDWLPNSISLALMSIIIWSCMLIVDLAYSRIPGLERVEQDKKSSEYNEMQQASEMQISVSNKFPRKQSNQQLSQPENEQYTLPIDNIQKNVIKMGIQQTRSISDC